MSSPPPIVESIVEKIKEESSIEELDFDDPDDIINFCYEYPPSSSNSYLEPKERKIIHSIAVLDFLRHSPTVFMKRHKNENLLRIHDIGHKIIEKITAQGNQNKRAKRDIYHAINFLNPLLEKSVHNLLASCLSRVNSIITAYTFYNCSSCSYVSETKAKSDNELTSFNFLTTRMKVEHHSGMDPKFIASQLECPQCNNDSGYYSVSFPDIEYPTNLFILSFCHGLNVKKLTEIPDFEKSGFMWTAVIFKNEKSCHYEDVCYSVLMKNMVNGSYCFYKPCEDKSTFGKWYRNGLQQSWKPHLNFQSVKYIVYESTKVLKKKIEEQKMNELNTGKEKQQVVRRFSSRGKVKRQPTRKKRLPSISTFDKSEDINSDDKLETGRKRRISEAGSLCAENIVQLTSTQETIN